MSFTASGIYCIAPCQITGERRMPYRQRSDLIEAANGASRWHQSMRLPSKPLHLAAGEEDRSWEPRVRVEQELGLDREAGIAQPGADSGR